MQKYLVNKFPGTILSPNIIIAQAVREEKKIFLFRHISVCEKPYMLIVAQSIFTF